MAVVDRDLLLHLYTGTKVWVGVMIDGALMRNGKNCIRFLEA
jgi:hypothetical protein